MDDAARKSFQKFVDGLEENERAMLRRSTNFYVATFKNIGGLVMPIIVRVHYTDNTNELITIPVDIWRANGDRASKLFVTEKEIARLELDPRRELADTEVSNNHWPPRIVPSRFKLYKDDKKKNPMQKLREKNSEKSKADDEPEGDPSDDESDTDSED